MLDVAAHDAVLTEIQDNFSNLEGPFDFQRWLADSDFAGESDIHAVCGLQVHVPPPDVVAFCEKVIPRLAAMIRAELEAEGYSAKEVTP